MPDERAHHDRQLAEPGRRGVQAAEKLFRERLEGAGVLRERVTRYR